MSGTNKGDPSWRWRRIVIYAVVVWACYQLFLLIDAQDSRLNETIAWGWQVLIMALVLGYTGFATVQDVTAIWRTRSGKPYSDAPAPNVREGWPQDIAPPERWDEEP
jgi:phosphoglycerol transferase MdoB-like AlkP superfamily enzyme